MLEELRDAICILVLRELASEVRSRVSVRAEFVRLFPFFDDATRQKMGAEAPGWCCTPRCRTSGAVQRPAVPSRSAGRTSRERPPACGENSLLLEGPSDLIYCDVLTKALALQGQPGLDPRWVKILIGGAGKLSTFVTLLGANKLNVAVVVDDSTKDIGAVKRLRDNDQLDRWDLVEISEFVAAMDADIEDLLEPDFYLGLVNRAYASDLPAPLTLADLNPHDPRIVRQVETHFKDNGIAGGRFSHYRPAAELLRQQATLIPQISSATLDRASLLFKRLNEMIK